MRLNLIPHPEAPPSRPAFEVWANVEHASALGAVASTNIWFGVGAPASRFVMPESEKPVRAENLWQTTCFEVFLRAEGEDSYREWNFAPSGDWAAYDFKSYRAGMEEAAATPPYIRIEDNMSWWELGATIAVPARDRWRLGLSAVLEEKDGTKSFWALDHPPGDDKPDFHHPDCFAARLP